MPIMTQQLYDFLEGVKANLQRNPPAEALRSIALDALLLAQDYEQEEENGHERPDSSDR